MNPQRVVTSTIIATGAVVLFSDVQQGNGVPTPQTWIGLGALFFLLGFAADFAPQIAVPLALVIFFAVLAARGEALMNGLTRATRKRRLKVVRGGGGKNVS